MLYLLLFYIIKIKYFKFNNLTNDKLINQNQTKEKINRTIQLHIFPYPNK